MATKAGPHLSNHLNSLIRIPPQQPFLGETRVKTIRSVSYGRFSYHWWVYWDNVRQTVRPKDRHHMAQLGFELAVSGNALDDMATKAGPHLSNHLNSLIRIPPQQPFLGETRVETIRSVSYGRFSYHWWVYWDNVRQTVRPKDRQNSLAWNFHRHHSIHWSITGSNLRGVTSSGLAWLL